MRSLAQRLIAAEFRPDDLADTESQAAFRVCEKLRRQLSIFAGVAGYRALAIRAMTLARRDSAWLRGLSIQPDGSIPFAEPSESELDKGAAVSGRIALIDHIIALLGTFIGESLTLRLIQEAWPKTALKNLESRDLI